MGILNKDIIVKLEGVLSRQGNWGAHIRYVCVWSVLLESHKGKEHHKKEQTLSELTTQHTQGAVCFMSLAHSE